MDISATTMGKLEDFLEIIPSKYTRKNYVNGIKRFEEWYGDSITKLIKSPDATKTVEKFYVALKQKHPQNTCRNVTNAPIQFLKYFGTDVRPRKALGIYRTEKAIDDHRLTIDEVQKMAKYADLREQIVIEVLLLGLRIADAIALKVSDLNKLEQPAPIELKLRATKAGTVYETFICEEFKELLKKYLPTLKGKWLFSGIRNESHVKDETLNTLLKELASRAGIQLHGNLHWHCGRKLVMTTGAELGLNTWVIKKMVGKSIQMSDDTYLNVQLKEGFLKLRSVLRLMPRIAEESLSDVEELTNICTEAIVTTFKPKIREMLLKWMIRNGTDNQTLGFIEMPNIDAMSNKQLLELYIKLKKEENGDE